MKTKIRIIISVIVMFFFMTACSSPDYSVENFQYFKNLAQRNGEDAINQLRYFVHYNPEHAEGNLLLGKLFMENANEERDYYLALHYLQEAIKHTESQSLAEDAMNLRMQISLLRGSSPGDPYGLLEIAEFALDNDQPALAAINYLRAAKEFLVVEDIGNAHDCSNKSQKILNKELTQKNELNDLDNLQEKLMIAQHILTTTNIIQGEYDDAKKFLKYIQTHKDEYDTPDYLPETDFLSAVGDAVSQASRPGRLKRFAIWSDHEEVNEEELLLLLDNSDRTNRNIRDITRYKLSELILETVLRDIDCSRAPEVADYVQRQLQFYSQATRSIE